MEIKPVKNFASDNNSGVLPQMMEALHEANQGHAHAYGGDEMSQRAFQKFKEHFGDNVDVHFVFNGTAANVLSLKTLLKSYECVICSEHSHLNMDECGAPEAWVGCKLMTIPTQDAKITTEQMERFMIRGGDQHYMQPKVVSITQPTELGTVYTPEEMKTIADWCHKRNMYLHVDGARFVNAAVSLDKTLKEISADVGVDVLSFGGTKNGLLFGEAVIFFDSKLSKDFKFLRKQAMQLGSKVRFIANQFYHYLSNNLWKEVATHSCEMAKLLEEKLQEIPEVKITQEVQTSTVFAIPPKEWIKPLKNKYFFYVWDEDTYESRWMCTFDTTEEDIDGFVGEMKRLQS